MLELRCRRYQDRPAREFPKVCRDCLHVRSRERRSLVKRRAWLVNLFCKSCIYLASLTSCHENTADNQELLVVSAENAKKNKHDAGSRQNTKTDRQAANANLHGIMAIYIERLGRPEHENGEEVCARDECDDEGENESTRLLVETLWEDGVFGVVCFPDDKGNHEDDTNNQWGNNMSRRPFVLTKEEEKELAHYTEACVRARWQSLTW